MSELLLDRAGRRRSPAALPGFHAGHAPGNKRLRYPADPPKVEEIIAVMRAAGDAAHGRRLRGLIVIMWRRGCASRKRSLSPRVISINAAAHCWFGAARAGAVARSAWTLGLGTAQPWLELRRELPVGPLLCVINGTTRGRHWSPPRHAPSCGAPPPRQEWSPLRAAPAPSRPRRRDGPRRRTADRHPAPTGHSNLGITSVYLQGIDSGGVIETVHARRAPMIPVSASLRLYRGAPRALLVAHCATGNSSSRPYPSRRRSCRSRFIRAASS